jgi:surface protein
LSDKLYREDKNIIKYKIKKGDTKVKIFGEHFVKTNRNNCRIICDKKEYNLMEYFDIENYNNDKNILELELKINENLTDMSYMFDNCNTLLYLSSNYNTNEVNNMSYMFKDCLSLSSLPDISEWDTSNVTNISRMFSNCVNLQSLPDISKWNT